jgi:S1-C subfamily serine protease
MTRILILLASLLVVGCAGTGGALVRSTQVLPSDTTFYFNEGLSSIDPLGISLEIENWLKSRNYKVVVTRKPFSQIDVPESTPSGGTGTGFFVSRDGLFITNSHVVQGGSSFLVRTTDGSIHNASLVTNDPDNDLALLRVDATLSQYFSLSDSNAIRVGEEVHTIGYPMTDVLGVSPRVTKGIINATVGLDNNPSSFQFSAQVQPGNSGGPVLNNQFLVTGITTSRLNDAFSIERYGVVPQDVNFGKKANYIKLLIESSGVDTTAGIPIESLDDAIKATGLLLVDLDPNGNVLSQKKPEVAHIALECVYQYYWDVFVWQVTHLKLIGTDIETGEVVFSIKGGQDSFAGKSAVMDNLFNSLNNLL